MKRRIPLRYSDYITFSNIASFAALTYFSYVVVSTYQNLSNPEKATLPAYESGQQNIESAQKKMDFMTMKDWHLFGQLENNTSQYVGQNEIPQETDLQIKLLGVFFLPEQKKNSFAIIETDGHEQKKYRLGDSMPGGITLLSITEGQVILLRNNHREALSMDRDKTSLVAKT